MQNGTSELERRFADLCDLLARTALRGPQAGAPAEVLMAWWHGEHSDFARLNRARLRQGGTVLRMRVDLRLIVGRRSATLTSTLAGEPAADRDGIGQALAQLRAAVADAPEDPYLLIDREPAVSHRVQPARLATPEQAIDTITDAGQGHDLVGAYMAGPIAVALWSSLGHRHYFESARWSFDFSIYAASDEGNGAGKGAGNDRRDKAVKSTVAADDWDADAVRAAIGRAVQDCEVLYRPARVLEPGHYRALLAPAALSEMIGMMTWGGFSARSHLTGQSPLSSLREGTRRFSERLTLTEDLAVGGAPAFQSDGFARAQRTRLIADGRFGEWLCSPRTASEFGIAGTGCGAGEQPVSMIMDTGDLPARDQLAALDRGIAISNLWYLNYSDRRDCRVTGMTRFATFWVENGVAVAPIAPMRFDDSLYDCLGAQLLALGDSAHWLPDLSSYEWREFGGSRLPAALVAALNFTL